MVEYFVMFGFGLILVYLFDCLYAVLGFNGWIFDVFQSIFPILSGIIFVFFWSRIRNFLSPLITYLTKKTESKSKVLSQTAAQMEKITEQTASDGSNTSQMLDDNGDELDNYSNRS